MNTVTKTTLKMTGVFALAIIGSLIAILQAPEDAAAIILVLGALAIMAMTVITMVQEEDKSLWSNTP